MEMLRLVSTRNVWLQTINLGVRSDFSGVGCPLGEVHEPPPRPRREHVAKQEDERLLFVQA
jgi:hypothetical protein